MGYRLGTQLRLSVLIGATSVGCEDREGLLLDAPCPCVEGFVCCEATQTCRRSIEGCTIPFSVSAVEPIAGPVEGGNLLSVQGQGFVDPIQVLVGGSSCGELDRVDGTRLVCRVPPGPSQGGPVSVQVSNPNQDLVLPEAYRYQRPWFAEPSVSGLENAPPGESAALQDLDQDDVPELLLSRADTPLVPLVIYRWIGGRFEANEPTSPAVVAHVGLGGADFDGDGRAELFFTGQEGTTPLTVLNPSGSGDWRPEPTESLAVGSILPPLPADVDGDGALELVGCRRFDEFMDEPRILILERVDGTWRRKEAEGSARPNLRCEMVSAADIDFDGDPDFASCGETLQLWENRGGRLFDITQSAGLSLLPFQADCSGLEWVDWNDDGLLDLAVTPEGESFGGAVNAPRAGLVLVRNITAQRGLAFEFAEGLDLDGPSPDCRSLDDAPREGASLRYGARASAWLDVDRDGDRDLFLPLPSFRCPLGPSLFLNRHRQGESGFIRVPLSLAGVLSGATSVARGDLDQDGDEDLVVHSRGPNAARVYLGQGAGLGFRRLRVWPRIEGRPAWGVTIVLWEGVPNESRRQVASLSATGRRGGSEPFVDFGLGVFEGAVTVRVDFGTGQIVERSLGAEIFEVEISP
ncbi:MAG: FG-GAP-like repeat-containing protein [Myxococcota bacterium]